MNAIRRIGGLIYLWAVAYVIERDTESSASRQHYIDTGRYLRPGEAIEL